MLNYSSKFPILNFVERLCERNTRNRIMHMYSYESRDLSKDYLFKLDIIRNIGHYCYSILIVILFLSEMRDKMRKWREENYRNSEQIVEVGEELINEYAAKLGDDSRLKLFYFSLLASPSDVLWYVMF